MSAKQMGGYSLGTGLPGVGRQLQNSGRYSRLLGPILDLTLLYMAYRLGIYAESFEALGP